MKLVILCSIILAFGYSCTQSPPSKIYPTSNLNIENLLTKQLVYAGKKQMDSVILIGIKIREIAEKEGDSLAIARSMLPIKGDVDVENQLKLEKYLPGAISYLKRHEYIYEQAKLQASYGAILATRGVYEPALKELLSSYDLLVKLDSLGPRFSVLLNIGNTFSGIGNHEKALIYYQKAKDFALISKDSLKISAAYLDLGIELKQTKTDSSLLYLEKAADYVPHSFRSFLQTKIDYNVAQALLAKKKFLESIKIFKNILDESNNRNEKEGIAMAHRGLATVYTAMNNFPLAKLHTDLSMQLLENIGGQDYLILEGLPAAIDLFERFGDYKEAFKYSQIFKAKNDSVLSLKKQSAFRDVELQYETEKKELENKILKEQLFIERVALSILALFLGALIYFYYVRARLLKERDSAYNSLIEKYNQSKANLVRSDTNQDQALLIQLNKYIETHRVYLNPKLKVDEVAEAIHSSQKDIAAVLKKEKNQNFNAYINQFRIEEVIRLFADLGNDHYKLEVLAGMAGFGSKQSFYSAFESVVGVKPALFRQKIANKQKALK